VDPQHHHIVAYLLHLLAGGFLGLISASVAGQFGWRAADRMPGESRLPHCVYCLKPFEWHQVFPLFGWALRPDPGSLPCPCGERKGLWAQPVMEITGFVLGCIIMVRVGWVWPVIPLTIGAGLLVAIALIDMYFGVIPDGLNVLTAMAGLAWTFGTGDVYFSLISAAVLLALGLFLALVYSRMRGKEMLGLGDVKFFAAAGLWLQPETAPWFLAVAGICGTIFGLVWQRAGGGKELPFAPSLCVALIACVFYQLLQTR
jgi:leader peptidase (prepilin peptidase)/N-methyltransferase